MRRCLQIGWLTLVLTSPVALAAEPTAKAPVTKVSLVDGKWHLNGEVTYRGTNAEGLLMNVRMVNAVFEDANDKTRPKGFDTDANTEAFIKRIPDYVSHGVRAFTLCLQGGHCGYEDAVNSAFNPDGSLRDVYLKRVRRVIEACDKNGAVVILGCYYQRQDQILKDEAAVRAGVVNTAKWIKDSGFTNVVLEIANEYAHKGFDHAILKSNRGEAELIALAKQTAPGLLVSTAGMGSGLLPDEVAKASDVLLIHFNTTKLEDIPARIAALQKYGKPIVCNEDDKVGAEGAKAAQLCVEAGASWGFMHKDVNQYFPRLSFNSAADDPAVYAMLKRLTTAKANEPRRDKSEAAAGAGATRSAEFECRFATGPITIDGVADEDAWKHAQTMERFGLPWLPDQPRAKAGTRAKLLWDRESLYFTAHMDDEDLFADIKERDGKTWQNDVFELFFKPADDKPGYYEFHVTPAGIVTDVFFPDRRKGVFHRGVRDDEFHIDAKVRCDGTLNQRQDRDRGWTVEGRIPWMDFLRTGGRPDVDERWKFALCRYDYRIDSAKPELSTCAPLTQANFHRHEDYAVLRFVGPSVVDSLRESKALAERVPYTPLERLKAAWPTVASRVVGSPDPPLPYQVQRVLPALSVSYPVIVVQEPGSKRLLFLDQPRPYGPTRLCRTADDPASGQFEVLLDLKTLCFDVVFHPRYRENGYLYIGGGNAAKRSCVTRYTISREPPQHLDPKSATVIIDWEGGGHCGCAMAFGPDGMLYVTSGDASGDSDKLLAGQGLDHLLSKVLRINVDRPDTGEPGGVSPRRNYSVPADNPFVGKPGVRPETWAYGLRNPWRMTIDQQTGQVWVGNNGQDLWEQVYLVERGANYGWSVYEGSHIFYANRKLGPTPVSKPLFEHPHSEARSLTGGVVYRGKRFPELHGAYIYGDYATGKIWGAKLEDRRVIWHKELTSSPLSITAFGLDADGELLIADHQGSPEGGFYTLESSRHTPRAVDGTRSVPTTFPRKLSETGLFASVSEHRFAEGMIPYSVNSPLWSDGAWKERALYLPPTAEVLAPLSNQSRPRQGVPGTEEPARIDLNDKNGWNFPDRTVLVKSFALKTEAGNPTSRRWIETRLFTRQAGEWVGYSYRWNDAQTEALLVAKEGQDQTFAVRSADGGVTRQPWRYPSRTECMVCHSRAANFVLGLSTVQMNKVHDYGGMTANQLEVLEYLGVLRNDPAAAAKAALHKRLRTDGLFMKEADELVSHLTNNEGQRAGRPSRLLSRPAGEHPRLVDPADARQDLSARTRSYLHANCAHCHVTSGGGNAQINLHFATPLAKMGMLDVEPMHDRFHIENARLVAPGHPERSVLLHRVATRGQGQMPQLATALADQQAVDLIRAWIGQLKPYFPPPDSEGGWRTLKDAAEIRRVAGMDKKKLDEAFAFIQGSTKNGGLLVLRNGWLVYEDYFGLGHRDATPNLASVGKSFTSIAVGMLLSERPKRFPDGLDQKVFTPEYLPPEAFPLTDPRKKDIKLGQLLAMTAGIRGNNPVSVLGKERTIDPAGPDGAPSCIDAVAFGKQEGNYQGRPYSTKTLWCDPGEGYSYATSSIHLASVVLRHVTGMELQQYVDKHLAKPMGWGTWGYAYRNASDVKHTPGGGGIAVRATDMLRFGELLRHEGRWQDKQLVPAEYVRHCSRMSPYNPHYPYSLQFTVNADGHFKELPRDAYWKSGSGGHVLYVVPSLDLVVWKLGGRDEQYAPANTGLKPSPAAPEQVAARRGWKETVDREAALRQTLKLVLDALTEKK